MFNTFIILNEVFDSYIWSMTNANKTIFNDTSYRQVCIINIWANRDVLTTTNIINKYRKTWFFLENLMKIKKQDPFESFDPFEYQIKCFPDIFWKQTIAYPQILLSLYLTCAPFPLRQHIFTCILSKCWLSGNTPVRISGL